MMMMINASEKFGAGGIHKYKREKKTKNERPHERQVI